MSDQFPPKDIDTFDEELFDEQSFQRWYDKDPLVSRAISSIVDLPQEYQILFSELITQFTKRIKETRKRNSEAVSIGTDRVLALYKSKTKKRSTDQDEHIYRAFWYLGMLEDVLRDFVSERIGHAILGVNRYLHHCYLTGTPEDRFEVKQFIKIVFEEGPSAGYEYLDVLGILPLADDDTAPESLPRLPEEAGEETTEEFIEVERVVSSKRSPSSPSGPKPSRVQEGDRGMRIKETRQKDSFTLRPEVSDLD
jgi:hypothetical protein